VTKPWRIEIEPEVRQWLELLTDAQYDKAEHGFAGHVYNRAEEERS